MQLSQEHIDEFKAEYKKHYGEELTNQEAADKYRGLIQFYGASAKLLANVEAKEQSKGK